MRSSRLRSIDHANETGTVPGLSFRGVDAAGPPVCASSEAECSGLTDGYLIAQEGRQPIIAFQAKAKGRDVLTETHVIYALPVKNYDDLRADTQIPRLLKVVVLPEADTDWIVHTEEELRLRRCGYWRHWPVNRRPTTRLR